jgi:hypothetical protein
MTLVRVFTSFDFDHDDDLRVMLIGQSKHPDTPFQIADWSVKEHLTGDWKAKVRERIRRVEQVCVICGTNTHTAIGVAAEVEMARAEGKPYFLLKGRKDLACYRPSNAPSSDKLYDWTWPNLKILINSGR